MGILRFWICLPVLLVGLPLLSCKDNVIEFSSGDGESAYLQLCPELITGCADRISIEETKVLIPEQKNNIQKSIDQLSQQRETNVFVKVPILRISYEVSRETGHFPNPTAEFDVIHIDSIEFK